jgi:large subunit ribosomal protein L24
VQATLLTLAIAVILALLAALFGPHFVDWNAQRGNFERQASALIGVPVRVGGKMDVRLLPSPTLVLADIEIGKPGDAQALRAKALGMEFALPALLSGKLRAVELKVIGPELKLSLDRDGRAVLPQALAGVNAEALSIDKLQIEDARVELSDAASDARLTLGKLWFNGEVRALPGPFRGEGAFVMDGGLYGYRISSARPEASGSRIKFTLDPSDRPVYAEAEGLLTAEGGAPRFEGLATVARRNAPVKGDKASSGESSGEPWKITSKVKANAAAALFEQVEFQYGPDERAIKLAGTAEAKFGAQPKLDAVLSARQLDADKLIAAPDGHKLTPRAAIAALLAAAGHAVRPPLPTQVGFSVDQVTLGGAAIQDLRGDLEIASGVATVTSLELRAPGFARIQATGRIDFASDKPSFAGPVDFSAVDPRAFSEWLDGKANAAPLPSKPLKARGEVTLGADRIAIDRMTAELDRNTFEGSLSYAAADTGRRARLDAKLRADDLDLDAWLALLGTSLPDVTRLQDVSLALTLGRLRFAGLEAGKTDIAINANATGIAIERFSIGDLGGAALDAKGRVDLDREIKGGVSFDLSLRDEAVLRALAERLAPAWSETLRRMAPSALPAKLTGRLDIEPASGGTNRFMLAAKGPLGANQLDLSSSLTGVWNNPRAGEVALKAALETADVNSLVALAAPGRIAPVARQPGRATLQLTGKPETDMRADMRLSSANLDLRAAGNVRAIANEDRSGALDIAIGPSPETQPHLLWPGSPAGGVPLALKAALKFDSVGLRFDNVQASVGGTDVTGRLGVGFGKPLVIDGELKTAALDLPALLAAATGLGGPNEKGNWSETPFAVSAWPSMIGAVSVNAARATVFPAMRAANLRTGLRFTGNDVVAEPIDAELFGGRLSGEVVMRRGGEGLGLSGRVALRDADVSQMLSPENAAALAGRAGLQLQFEGAGLSPRALAGSLHGGGKITFDKGRIASLDPKAFAAAIRSVDQGLALDASRIRDVVTRALEGGPLVVHQAEAQVSIAAGVLRIDSFAAKTDAADLIASGSYNLAESGLDARLALRGPQTAGSAQRPEFAIQLRGPFTSPQKSIDVSALTGWLAMRSVDQQTRKIEAIEQGRPAEAALQAPAIDPERSPSLPEVPPVLPRKRPQAAAPAVQPQPHSPQPAQRLEPLPPPIEIGPARPRVPPRADGAPQRPADAQANPQANPFPKPIGPSPQQAAPPPPPGGRVNPAF